MRNTYNFLCMTHQMYCSSWSELYPTFADLFQRTFITKRGKTWNESLIISIESSFLWVKAIASFEDRRDQNANTNTMWKLTSSSGQSRILDELFKCLAKPFNFGKDKGFLKPQQYLMRHLNPEVATNNYIRTTVWYLALSDVFTLIAPVIQSNKSYNQIERVMKMGWCITMNKSACLIFEV